MVTEILFASKVLITGKDEIQSELIHNMC